VATEGDSKIDIKKLESFLRSPDKLQIKIIKIMKLLKVEEK